MAPTDRFRSHVTESFASSSVKSVGLTPLCSPLCSRSWSRPSWMPSSFGAARTRRPTGFGSARAPVVSGPIPTASARRGQRTSTSIRFRATFATYSAGSPSGAWARGRGNSAAADWAEQELAALDVADERLRERAYTIARDFFARPRANIARQPVTARLPKPGPRIASFEIRR